MPRSSERGGRGFPAPRTLVAAALVAVAVAAAVPAASGAPGPHPAPAPTLAQPTPTPTLPNLLPSESPSPSPTRRPRPRPGDETPGGGDPAPPSPGPSPSASPGPGADGDGVPVGPPVPGAFDTTELMEVAARLRAFGWAEEDVIAAVYPPFIVAGYAAWSDTWGAPRYGPGPLVRTHEGQDVFCDMGAPVLAPESGIVTHDVQQLGGLVARVHRDDGSYWYLAHLSDWNTEAFPSGSRVEAGDVIGYCGRSGNAEHTPPHVHFGWYGPDGVRDPMLVLVTWLRAAEIRAGDLLRRVVGERIARISELETYRRFGDGFAPDRSELPNPVESLWGSGAVPMGGAFGVAQVALQRALTGASLTSEEAAGAPVPDGLVDDVPAISELSELLVLYGFATRP